jgi:hypothetical protein
MSPLTAFFLGVAVGAAWMFMLRLSWFLEDRSEHNP